MFRKHALSQHPLETTYDRHSILSRTTAHRRARSRTGRLRTAVPQQHGQCGYGARRRRRQRHRHSTHLLGSRHAPGPGRQARLHQSPRAPADERPHRSAATGAGRSGNPGNRAVDAGRAGALPSSCRRRATRWRSTMSWSSRPETGGFAAGQTGQARHDGADARNRSSIWCAICAPTASPCWRKKSKRWSNTISAGTSASTCSRAISSPSRLS